jgi:hypothetical protein
MAALVAVKIRVDVKTIGLNEASATIMDKSALHDKADPGEALLAHG